MWKDIQGWEELYEINTEGEIRNKKTQKLITGDINSEGYSRVCLYCKNHIPPKQRFFRHRLVAEHFIPNIYNKPEVNHKDGIISHNNVENLEWVTKTENELHSHKYGTKPYRPFQVRYADGTICQFEVASQLSETLGVTRRTIYNWLTGVCGGYQKYNIDTIMYV